MATATFSEVRRDNLRRSRRSSGLVGDLAPGQALLRVESFGLSANNVTYGAAGESLKYWRFFPAGEQGWGRIPVWGFARVESSRAEGLRPGTRVFGFLPFGTHLVVEPGRVGHRSFTDISEHRQGLPAVYNSYRLVDSDPMHDPGAEDVQNVFFPLFATSFMLDDFLADHDDFGAEQIVVSSASSKTAVGVALCIAHRDGPRPHVVGLTSSGNAQFVAGLGCYDEVTAYDDLATLPARPTVYVDIAGNGELRRRVHEHFDHLLRSSSAVGMAHWEMAPTHASLPGPKPTFFFAPTQIAKRMADWGPAGYQERLTAAWRDMVAGVRDRFTFVPVVGLAAADEVFRDMVEGRSRPDQAFVVDLAGAQPDAGRAAALLPLAVDPRYCGPPDTANGGYFAGRLAQSLTGPVEVTLRMPPPLSRPMTLQRQPDGIDVLDAQRLVAQARSAADEELDLDIPDPVSLAQAQHAEPSYIFAAGGHPFPTCFVCGTQREPGDGLRLSPGRVGDVVACTWTPHESLQDAAGGLPPEFLWAALDCPSFFGALAAGYADTAATVLGRITAQVRHRPDVGEPLVVQGWGISRQGRRSMAGSAIFTADGQLCAASRSVWVRLG